MANDGDIVARRPTQGASVARLFLHVRHHRALGHRAQGQDVPDGQGGLLASINELAGVHALVGDEGLGVLLVPVGIAEDDFGERRSPPRVMHDFLDDAADIAMALSVVERPEPRRCLVETGMGRYTGSE